jgi:hypothetical protein
VQELAADRYNIIGITLMLPSSKADKYFARSVSVGNSPLVIETFRKIKNHT